MKEHEFYLPPGYPSINHCYWCGRPREEHEVPEMRCEDCYVGDHDYRTSALCNIHCLCCDDMVNDPVHYALSMLSYLPHFPRRHRVIRAFSENQVPLVSPSRAPEPEYKDTSSGISIMMTAEAEQRFRDAMAKKMGYTLDDAKCLHRLAKSRPSRKELKRQLREVLEERNNLKDENEMLRLKLGRVVRTRWVTHG